jgi:phospholipid/cholesterol/gamma-HCH transport system ATP-binding protein
VGIVLDVREVGQRRGRDPKGEWLFRQLSFCWQSPGMHVILGPSGGGKSTFLKTLGGVWRPFEGRVMLGDQPLWKGSSGLNEDVLKRLGFAFQNNALFGSMRVVENLMFPHRSRYPHVSEPERLESALEWLERVGLAQVSAAFPHELSGGMQKRLSLARTLILEPELVLLDDPTAGLDPITSKTIADLLQTLLSGRNVLVIIVTNDPDRAKDWGPNLHVLRNGSLYSPGHAEYDQRLGVYL